jgi:polyisoprenoid-binding protein YceI
MDNQPPPPTYPVLTWSAGECAGGIRTSGVVRALEGKGTVTADGGITGTLVIDAASVDTKNKKRDTHLRTADLFEVETFPTITYEATSGRLVKPGTIDPDGTLTVHGESRPLSVSANVSISGDSVTVTSDVDIDRSAWGSP